MKTENWLIKSLFWTNGDKIKAAAQTNISELDTQLHQVVVCYWEQFGVD